MKRRSFLKWLGLGSLGLFGGGAAYGMYDPENYYYNGPKSDHFDGKTFFNPNGIKPRRLSEVLKWQLSGGRAKWPAEYPSPFHDAKPADRVNSSNLEVTMIGHATLLIQTAGLNFITDPVFVDRASPVQFAGPKRVNPPGIVFENLPPIDYVLLSHNHYDHLDLASLKRLSSEHNATIICPLGNDTIVKSKAPDANFIVGDWENTVNLNAEVKLHFEPCHHWSARGTKDRRMALWAAFLLETPAGKIYHIGDTGFHDGINYKALFEKHGAVDLAILPIGAYEPRWFMKGQHQNPDEAVQGHKLIQAKTSIGHHWGTFQLTNEAIEAPIEALSIARLAHGISEEEFTTLRPGQSWKSVQETA
ncbi:MAG: MBL fold metallo-hydrolase [Rhizobiaceae bacterium]|nr:MBL fold metallo-hydrolase [Rhizobiaceae bacterium]